MEREKTNLSAERARCPAPARRHRSGDRGGGYRRIQPIRDHADMTAMVAAKFYKELVGLLLR